MVGRILTPNNFQLQHEPTPRNDAKKIVSEVLKRVDQLIRKGDLDHAGLEVKKAKEVDPRNVYALALEERISILKAEFERVASSQFSEKTKNQPVLEKSPKKEIETPLTTPAPKIAQSITISLPAPTMTIPPPLPQSTPIVPAAPQKKREDIIIERSAELESYRKALTEAWCDGALTENETRQLDALRDVFGISVDEHIGFEKNVKIECYRNAMLRQLSDNSAAKSNANSLAVLRRTFQISEEDESHIQTQLMNIIQHKQRDKILVIDDDTRLLELLAAMLEDFGFDVTALPTSDEAYSLLRKFTPDLILCDINLETSTMGGFTFYEKVQELKNIQSIPFIFLTGLTDEALVRTGKELGVDDYLMKPISEQTLVSTLRGKLKRFRQIKKAVSTQMPVMIAA
jgi:CheY-like chemotaxis protein